MLKPIWSMTEEGDTELFAHVTCAVDAGFQPEELSKERCYHCDLQFYCEEHPEETALFIEVGGLDDDENFIADQRGAIHWACASRWWAPELFEEIEGTTITLEEAKNA